MIEVMNGATVIDVTRRYGVALQTLRHWLRRYEKNGIAGLADGSSNPATCPHQMPAHRQGGTHPGTGRGNDALVGCRHAAVRAGWGRSRQSIMPAAPPMAGRAIVDVCHRASH